LVGFEILAVSLCFYLGLATDSKPGLPSQFHVRAVA